MALSAVVSSTGTNWTRAIKVQTPSPSQYFLVEARLKTDPYEQGQTGLSRGIPSEGVMAYWIDESRWPPVHLRTPTALGVGQTFTAPLAGPDNRITVTGGSRDNVTFSVRVQVTEPAECQSIRSRIRQIDTEIARLQKELQEPDANKPEIMLQIRELRAERQSLVERAPSLGCAL